jgi:hypothetical protein
MRRTNRIACNHARERLLSRGLGGDFENCDLKLSQLSEVSRDGVLGCTRESTYAKGKVAKDLPSRGQHPQLDSTRSVVLPRPSTPRLMLAHWLGPPN